MGDWLEVKPQFPNGVAPLLAEAQALGFRPGLWIAPFMVGNRSKLAQEHPDWLARDARTGKPFVEMRFYGEFRWHKRSEEYHILDVTHPDAARYIGDVFRIWRHDWGASYFKTDFMHFGSAHGPDEVAWHEPGLSRIAIWRRMSAIIREAIGEDALWLGCGCPLWASVGLIDAVRISRDIGVTWDGEQSAQSLFRDLPARLHANGVLWQADPDCVLLRDRFHYLSAEQVEIAAATAAAASGVLMTSDHLGCLSRDRERLFAEMLKSSAKRIGSD
jgi:alpha-galactosidase